MLKTYRFATLFAGVFAFGPAVLAQTSEAVETPEAICAADAKTAGVSGEELDAFVAECLKDFVQGANDAEPNSETAAK
ncbi:MAG: hypothetical protein LJE84_11250 [Gammaproteobacteria bacterium]|nr:hypothetical protein [Gammaproteobacteria bacterium]